jgi:hypothetical protein
MAGLRPSGLPRSGLVQRRFGLNAGRCGVEGEFSSITGLTSDGLSRCYHKGPRRSRQSQGRPVVYQYPIRSHIGLRSM